MDGRQVNRTLVEQNTEQLGDLVPSAPIDNQQVGPPQLFPNSFINSQGLPQGNNQKK